MEDLRTLVAKKPGRWLVTGAAGFIGSHLCEFLLSCDQEVTGLDNFSTGFQHNLDDLVSQLSNSQRNRFTFLEADIRNFDSCKNAVRGAQYVLHQAALGSVPRSIEDPIATNEVNVSGFVNMLRAAQLEGVKRFVFASSSSVYGDSPHLPKIESQIGNPLSPYAVSKLVNEIYARNFSDVYGLETIGLRYFNVFGPRQNPKGPYAAVIPIWIDTMLRGEACVINGDGSTSRDFCYIANVVQANIRAALTEKIGSNHSVFNIAASHQTSLLELHSILQDYLSSTPGFKAKPAEFRPFRKGDVLHSLADITAAKNVLKYKPAFQVAEGLRQTVKWFVVSSIS